MPISLRDRFAMSLRQTPVGVISRALATCEAAGVAATAKDLESHFLCGKDPIALAEGLVLAKQLGVEASLAQMSAAVLAGHDVKELMLKISEDRRESWGTFSPTRPDVIRGFTRDGTEVRAVIDLVFRLTVPQAAFGYTGRTLHERLGAAVSVFINTAESRRELEMKRSSHEAELNVLAVESLPRLKSLALTYRS